MDELEREAQIDAFFAMLEEWRKLEPPLTAEEINEEIAADRREQLQLKIKNSQ